MPLGADLRDPGQVAVLASGPEGADMAIEISGFTSGDDVFVHWRMPAPIPKCLGFALYRRRNKVEALVENYIGFLGVMVSSCRSRAARGRSRGSAGRTISWTPATPWPIASLPGSGPRRISSRTAKHRRGAATSTRLQEARSRCTSTEGSWRASGSPDSWAVVTRTRSTSD